MRTEEGEEVEGLPVFDVTDGWYVLRATVDEPMARAVKGGKLRVGSKIAVSGARVSSVEGATCCEQELTLLHSFKAEETESNHLLRTTKFTLNSAGTQRQLPDGMPN